MEGDHGPMGREDAEKRALILVGYALTMKAVQEFEQQLKSIAIYREELPDEPEADAAWRRVEKMLRAPLGRLAKAVPSELQEHWEEIKRVRNQLAHETLVLWQFERRLGLRSDEELVDLLLEYESSFLGWAEALEPVAHQCLLDKGINPEELEVSREEMRRMILDGEQAAGS